MAKSAKKVRVQLVRSTIGQRPNQKRTIEALGLRKINSVVEKTLNPAVQGMIDTVAHLVTVEEIK